MCCSVKKQMMILYDVYGTLIRTLRKHNTVRFHIDIDTLYLDLNELGYKIHASGWV